MSTRTFRILLAVYILIAVASGISDFATRNMLPEPLREYHAAEYASEMSQNDWLLAFGGMTVLALAVISTIGLFLFWRPARLLYTLSYVITYVLIFLMGPTVSTPLTAFLVDLGTFLGGVIWALIYFSPLKEYFEPVREPAAP